MTQNEPNTENGVLFEVKPSPFGPGTAPGCFVAKIGSMRTVVIQCSVILVYDSGKSDLFRRMPVLKVGQ
jgi:hypothetical protein